MIQLLCSTIEVSSDTLGGFMETALNKSLRDVAAFMLEHLTISDHCMIEQTDVDDDIVALSAPVAKRQKISITVTSLTKHIGLRKGHFYVNNK